MEKEPGVENKLRGKLQPKHLRLFFLRCDILAARGRCVPTGEGTASFWFGPSCPLAHPDQVHLLAGSKEALRANAARNSGGGITFLARAVSFSLKDWF